MRPGAAGARAAPLLLCWIALLAVAVAVGELLRHGRPGFDLSLLRSVEGSPGTGATGFFRAIVPVGQAPVLDPLFVVALVALLLARRRREALLLVLASPGALLLIEAAKRIVARPRPPVHHLFGFSGWSWPSADAGDATALYGALAVICLRLLPGPRRWSLGARWLVAALALGLSLLVGIERVYLGVHYPTDVAGGWLLAAAWLAVASRVDSRRG